VPSLVLKYEFIELINLFPGGFDNCHEYPVVGSDFKAIEESWPTYTFSASPAQQSREYSHCNL